MGNRSNLQVADPGGLGGDALLTPPGRTAGSATSATSTAMPVPLVSVSNLTRSYGPRVAVSDVSFVLEPGVTGLLGPNGAGKSTLVRCLAGLSRWDEGEVRIVGIDPARHPRDARKHVGYMPERVSFPPEMRVSDYLHFSAAARGIARKERGGAVEAVLGHAGLAHVASRIVANLSKGYRQRVGLAQALLTEPPVLILDEPSAGLDPLNVIEMRDSLRSYAAKRAVLVSTHILPETRLLCDRVLVMSQGRLVYHGSPGAMEAGISAFTLRVRASGPHTAPPVVGEGAKLVACTAMGGDYDVVVEAPDEATIGRLVGQLHTSGWLVIRVEPTGDSLETAFRHAVLGSSPAEVGT